MERFFGLAAGVDFCDQLADAINQDVLVVDRRQAERAGDDGDFRAVMFIVADGVVRLGGEGKYRVFHGPHIVLGGRVHDIADKEILYRVPVRQQRVFWF